MSTKQNLNKAFTILYELYETNQLPNDHHGICDNFSVILNEHLKLTYVERRAAYEYMLHTLFLNYPDRAKNTIGTHYKGYIVDGPEEDPSTYWKNPKRIKLLKWLIEQTKE